MLAVAIDHALYSWPCRGLEERGAIIDLVAAAGADALISTYGTIRDHRPAFGRCRPILKLDLTTVTLGGHYPVSEYVQAWSVSDAQRLEVDAVLTFVQLGAPFELEALRTAARVAAEADREGVEYVCEIMPVQSELFPDEEDPEAIAAAARTAAELGASIVKTTMPRTPGEVGRAVACGRPVILAGGALTDNFGSLLASVRSALSAGAAGVAFGRNVWGAADPAGVVSALRAVVHEVVAPEPIAHPAATRSVASEPERL